jgi:hypothetical protein
MCGYDVLWRLSAIRALTHFPITFSYFLIFYFSNPIYRAKVATMLHGRLDAVLPCVTVINLAVTLALSVHSRSFDG